MIVWSSQGGAGWGCSMDGITRPRADGVLEPPEHRPAYATALWACTLPVRSPMLQASQLRILVWSETLVTLSMKIINGGNNHYKPIHNWIIAVIVAKLCSLVLISCGLDVFEYGGRCFHWRGFSMCVFIVIIGEESVPSKLSELRKFMWRILWINDHHDDHGDINRPP